MSAVGILSIALSLLAMAAFFVGGFVLTILACLDAEVRSGGLVSEIQPQSGGVRRAAG
jgi:hypothetical protein